MGEDINEKLYRQEKMQPLVSIIIPVYNVEQYLERCVNTVLKQTIYNIEIILVNDGSEDNSGEKCEQLKKYDSRICVIHQKNAGLASARNTGLSIATGKYIGFVDSDDWIPYDYYEKLYNLLEQNDADIVSCAFFKSGHHHFEKKKSNVYIMDTITAQTWLLNSAIASGNNDVSCCTKLYREDTIRGLKFHSDIIFEDVLFNWFAIGNCKKYVRTSEKLYCYFTNPKSITTNVFSDKTYDLVKGAKIIKETYNGGNKKLNETIDMYLAKSHYSVLIKMLKTKKIDRSKLEKELIEVKNECRTLMMSPLSLIRKLALLYIWLVPSAIILDQKGL